MLPYKDIKSL